MKCLVTGFEAFEGVDDNPTEKIARDLPTTLDGVTLEVEILPVEYGIVDRVLAEPRHKDVAGVFMLGAAGEAEFGRLEVQAFNWKSSSVSDNSGNLERGQTISPQHPANHILTTHVDIDALLHSVQASVMPWKRSEDPGRFVCNDSYFRMLMRSAQQASSCPTLFVHIPVPERASTLWNFETVSGSVHLLLREFLKTLRL
ncbi:MAG: hypothetical protein VX210_08650 [Myxococcota bacterium]|nr:hypothetical protein [Myxococcota bacterium]